jgi:hypothetical protein
MGCRQTPAHFFAVVDEKGACKWQCERNSAEIHRLRKDAAKRMMERKLLKKAAACFARESMRSSTSESAVSNPCRSVHSHIGSYNAKRI